MQSQDLLSIFWNYLQCFKNFNSKIYENVENSKRKNMCTSCKQISKFLIFLNYETYKKTCSFFKEWEGQRFQIWNWLRIVGGSGNQVDG